MAAGRRGRSAVGPAAPGSRSRRARRRRRRGDRGPQQPLARPRAAGGARGSRLPRAADLPHGAGHPRVGVPPRDGALPRREEDRHEGDRVLHRVRPEAVVVPAGRDRVRRQADPRRRLRADHRDEQPRGGRPRRRGPHLPPAVLLAPPRHRRGRSGDEPVHRVLAHDRALHVRRALRPGDVDGRRDRPGWGRRGGGHRARRRRRRRRWGGDLGLGVLRPGGPRQRGRDRRRGRGPRRCRARRPDDRGRAPVGVGGRGARR